MSVRAHLLSLIGAALLLGVAPPARLCAGTLPAAQSGDEADLFQAAGTLYGLDPALLATIAEVESGGRLAVVSPRGAAGLMQLMPATADRYGVVDRDNPVESVLGAAHFLDNLRASGLCGAEASLPLAELIAAYNAGPAAVCRHGGVPPYAETRAYVRRVLWLYLLDAPPARADSNFDAIPAAPRGHEAAAATGAGGDLAILHQLGAIRAARHAAAGGGSP